MSQTQEMQNVEQRSTNADLLTASGPLPPAIKQTNVDRILSLRTELCPTHHAYLGFILTHSHELMLGTTTTTNIADAGLQVLTTTMHVVTAPLQREISAPHLATLARLRTNGSDPTYVSLRYAIGQNSHHHCQHTTTEYSTEHSPVTEANFGDNCTVTLQLVDLTNQQAQALTQRNTPLCTLNYNPSVSLLTLSVDQTLRQELTEIAERQRLTSNPE